MLGTFLFLSLLVAQSCFGSGQYLKSEYLNLVMEMLNESIDKYYSFIYEYGTRTLLTSTNTIKIFPPILIMDNITSVECKENVCTLHLYLPGGFEVKPYSSYSSSPRIDFDYCTVDVTFPIDIFISKPVSISVKECDLLRYENASVVSRPEEYVKLLSQALYYQAISYEPATNGKMDLSSVQQVFEHLMRKSFPRDYVMKMREQTTTHTTPEPGTPAKIIDYLNKRGRELKNQHTPETNIA